MSFPILLIAITPAGLCVAASDIGCQCNEFTTAVASHHPSGATIFRGVNELEKSDTVDLSTSEVFEVP